MFLTIIPYIFDIRVMTIMSIAGWAIFIIFLIFMGYLFIKKAEQMKQDEETISPERESDE